MAHLSIDAQSLGCVCFGRIRVIIANMFDTRYHIELITIPVTSWTRFSRLPAAFRINMFGTVNMNRTDKSMHKFAQTWTRDYLFITTTLFAIIWRKTFLKKTSNFFLFGAVFIANLDFFSLLNSPTTNFCHRLLTFFFFTFCGVWFFIKLIGCLTFWASCWIKITFTRTNKTLIYFWYPSH